MATVQPLSRIRLSCLSKPLMWYTEPLFSLCFPSAVWPPSVKRNGCATKPKEDQLKPTVEELTYQDCEQPVVLYRVHHNGHTWPGHPLGLDRDTMVDYFSGKTTGTPFPLMVASRR